MSIEEYGLVSIIVPVYNAEKYLVRCVDSLLNQDYRDIEIVLVNDGSKDNSLEILRKYEALNSRVHVIDKRNGGVSSARNMGIREATGKFVMFVDSDDWVAEDYCSKMLQQLHEDNSEMALCGFVDVRKDTQIVHLPLSKKELYGEDFKRVCLDMLQTGMSNSPCNKLFLRNKIKFYFDENRSMGEDLEFNLMYMEGIESISCINYAPYYYDKTNESSLTHQITLLEKTEIENLLLRERFIKAKQIVWDNFADQFYLSFFRLLKRYYKVNASYVVLKKAFNRLRFEVGYDEVTQNRVATSYYGKLISVCMHKGLFLPIYVCLMIRK